MVNTLHLKPAEVSVSWRLLVRLQDLVHRLTITDLDWNISTTRRISYIFLAFLNTKIISLALSLQTPLHADLLESLGKVVPYWSRWLYCININVVFPINDKHSYYVPLHFVYEDKFTSWLKEFDLSKNTCMQPVFQQIHVVVQHHVSPKWVKKKKKKKSNIQWFRKMLTSDSMEALLHLVCGFIVHNKRHKVQSDIQTSRSPGQNRKPGLTYSNN